MFVCPDLETDSVVFRIGGFGPLFVWPDLEAANDIA